MILFKERYREKILAGRKWQSRRLWARPRVREGSQHLLYTRLPIMGERPFARALVTKIWQQRLGETTQEEARAEGCNSVEAFLQEFSQVYRGKIPGDPKDVTAWVVEFQVVERFV